LQTEQGSEFLSVSQEVSGHSDRDTNLVKKIKRDVNFTAVVDLVLLGGILERAIKYSSNGEFVIQNLS
jgi:hypothetical protein